MNDIIKSDPRDAINSYLMSSGAKLLLFKQGAYILDDAEVPLGTRFEAKVLEQQIGWNRWEAQRPVESVMGYLHEGFIAPSRNDLGHFDQSEWEKDQNDKSRDPWQLAERLPFITDNGEEVIFATGSWGGHFALVELQKNYKRNGEGRNPVIELAMIRRKNQYGGVNPAPAFPVIGWVTPGAKAQVALPPKKSASEIVQDTLPTWEGATIPDELVKKMDKRPSR